MMPVINAVFDIKRAFPSMVATLSYALWAFAWIGASCASRDRISIELSAYNSYVILISPIGIIGKNRPRYSVVLRIK